MMRSLFSGVSGLRNHQTGMDVIGNNIANVNTPGFKASRVTFQDILSQTMQGASSPQGNRGGTNPMQVGLGMGVASIDTLFTAGPPQTTGKQTDLYISGEGFFIVSDGANQYYTRAGNFDFDLNGNYGIPGSGLKVMGWMPDATGAINTTGPVTSIQIPAGTTMPPQVSSEITVGKNLTSDGDGMAAGIASADTHMTFTGALNQDADIGTVVSFQVQTYLASGAQAPVTVNFMKTGAPPSNTWSVSTGGSTASGVPFTVGSTSLALSIDDGAGGTMPITVDTTAIGGGAANTLTGTASTVAADADTALKLDGLVSDTAATGDTIDTTIQVIDNTGARVSVPITLTKTANANEWSVSTTSADITIPAAPANTFTIPAATPIAITGTGTLAGLTSLDLSGITVGKAATANTGIDVYDSLGTAHKVEYTFTKSGVPGEWTVSAKVDGKNAVVANNKVVFNSEGVLISPISASTGPQVTVPGSGGAASFPVTMNLFKEDGTTPAITQYSGESSVFANSTDGYTAGTIDMSKLTVDQSGIITATFTNGKSKSLGQVALATFNNPGGLNKVGDTLFAKSNNSGEPQIGTGGSSGHGTLTAGALEMSNVDLAQEFSNMIITQRGFQANSKIITTTDEMLETLANLKR
jgi:flagellar hook protein FlgE